MYATPVSLHLLRFCLSYPRNKLVLVAPRQTATKSSVLQNPTFAILKYRYADSLRFRGSTSWPGAECCSCYSAMHHQRCANPPVTTSTQGVASGLRLIHRSLTHSSVSLDLVPSPGDFAISTIFCNIEYRKMRWVFEDWQASTVVGLDWQDLRIYLWSWGQIKSSRRSQMFPKAASLFRLPRFRRLH
jgi:hypothetical protein